MRRGFAIGLLLLVVLGGIAIGVGAYHAGYTNGLEATGRATEVVRVVGPGAGFFPFGLFLFPLFFLGIFFLARSLFWRGRWNAHSHERWGPGPWGKGAPGGFEDWHRRQHDESGGERPGSGEEPASV